ncbi:MAG: hypothetical protein HC836_25790 [Richelia sp. RM2_1_2]|nr:hypothetical protein [Richelia sp. RM2_1_2]
MSERSELSESTMVIRTDVYHWLLETVGRAHCVDTWTWVTDIYANTITFGFWYKEHAALFKLIWS